MLKHYLQIIKPNIIFSNLISITGGFLLASKGSITNYNTFISVLVGMLMIIASSCIINNYIDRDIDSKMERTKNRALVLGLISPIFSLIYAILLGFFGFLLMWSSVNQLACWLAIIGFFIYVGIYSLYMKRYSIYSTLIGSLSGSVPPIVGYCTVTNKFDIEAIILLAIFIFWQIPHFYSIVIFHFKDYLAANIPALPVIKGISATKKHITLHIIAFILFTLTLSFSGYTGYKYLIISTLISLCWLIIALLGFKTKDDKSWARKIFLYSIFVITSISTLMSVDS